MVHDYWFTDPSNEFFRQQEGCERHLNACLVGEFDKDLPIHLADYLEMKFNEWLQNSSRVEP